MNDEGRKSRSNRKPIAVRVDSDVHELLELARVFHDRSSMQELIEPLLVDFAISFGAEPEVKETLRLKEAYRARKDKGPVSLSDRKRVEDERDTEEA